MDNSAPTGPIFIKFGIWGCFRKSAEKIQAVLKTGRNNGYFTLREMQICAGDTENSCRENQNTFYVLQYFFRKLEGTTGSLH
jgi:hypothetical protein